MRKACPLVAIECVVVSAISGCGAGLPKPPKTAEGRRVEVLSLDRTDVEEVAAVKIRNDIAELLKSEELPKTLAANTIKWLETKERSAEEL